MICCHRYKFIFLRPRKVASTSIEMALRKICTPDDIVTKSASKNHIQLLGDTPLRHIGASIRHTFPDLFGYWHHMPARQVRRMIGEDIWRSYYKFSVERNPWDRQVSLYYHRTGKHDRNINFETFVTSSVYRTLHMVKLNNYDIYSINGKIAVDFVMRYENLTEDLQKLIGILGVEECVTLGDFRSNWRKEKRDYREYYNNRTRNLIAKWYRREIEAFGYSF